MEIDKYEGYYLWNANDPSDASVWKGAWHIDGQSCCAVSARSARAV
jgi:hypothetical protein